jgi:hypothetical protein
LPLSVFTIARRGGVRLRGGVQPRLQARARRVAEPLAGGDAAAPSRAAGAPPRRRVCRRFVPPRRHDIMTISARWPRSRTAPRGLCLHVGGGGPGCARSLAHESGVGVDVPLRGVELRSLSRKSWSTMRANSSCLLSNSLWSSWSFDAGSYVSNSAEMPPSHHAYHVSVSGASNHCGEVSAPYIRAEEASPG